MHNIHRAKKGDKVFTQDFESVSDYVRHASETPAANGAGVASREDNPDFFRTKTFEEAVALASAGWPEGAARVAELRDGCEAFLAAAKSAKTRGYGWDVEGHFIDVITDCP